MEKGTIHLPIALHRALKVEAAKAGISLQTFIEQTLRRALPHMVAIEPRTRGKKGQRQ
jgi:predicted HicB family RNase H-like nuclease